ncbi:hypothetical protein C2S51_003560 [Perilla frutescens var. frutescens]|nr:hypothetical protein C2S51_003560 [Perilla frutescens var. frutescens]
MDSSQSMFSPSSLLLCEENLGSLDCEDDEGIVLDDCDDAYIRVLLDREISNGGPQMQEFLQNSWIQRARLEGIHYILRKREVLGFGFQTAYASVTYFDRFLSRRSIDADKSWAIRLLSMACLSLAAKMEEIRVPALSEFCVDDYNFESSVIQRMELLVLNTLGWKMGSFTPFSFIKFFASKFYDDRSLPKNGFSRIVDLILSSTRDAKMMCHMPSEIAAAATLVVLDQGLTKDALQLKIAGLASSYSFKIESIISCYNLFKEVDIERLNLSKGIESPGLSPIQLQPYGSSSVTSAKRKRLLFNEIDELGDMAEKKPKP